MGGGFKAAKGFDIGRLKSQITSDTSISDDTRKQLLAAAGGSSIEDPRTGKKRRFGGQELQSIFDQARKGAGGVFRERQQREKTKTLLADRPGRTGLIG